MQRNLPPVFPWLGRQRGKLPFWSHRFRFAPCSLLPALVAVFLFAGCEQVKDVRLGDFNERRGPLPLSGSELWSLGTTGGDAGRVIEVTTLAAGGPGSLRAALDASGPRRVVFKVGGVIDLEAANWRITEPYLTLDAGSAPEPGITLIRGGITIAAHDVIVRHLRVRPGEAGHAKRSGWEMDGIMTDRGAYDVIVENCSLSWATDENLSASGPRFEGENPDEWRRNTSHRILFRDNLIAEGLSLSTHVKNEHSKGTLIHDNVTQLALIGNLYASNMERNPLFKGGTRAIAVNNVVHNPGKWAIHYALVASEWEGRERIPGELVLVGNIVQPGPSTPREMPMGNFTGGCRVFTQDNRFLDPRTLNLGIPWIGQYTELKTVPFWLDGYTPLPSEKVLESVLQKAGARPWSRDAVDTRIIAEVRGRRGSIKHSETEAGGYPIN